MLKIGLTGNIGSGKSICSRIFSLLGVPVYNADVEAKKLYFNSKIKDKVIQIFGKEILTANEIDKIKLSKIVFNDSAALEALNSIIHPEVKNDFDNWINKQNADIPYIIQEAAIIYESGFDKYFDKIIVVTAPLDIRIARITKRDQLNEIDIINRINKQMPDDIKSKKADYLINNSGVELVIPQIINIHISILQ